MIRLALKNDIHRVYNWRNLPEIIKLGTENKHVSWLEHYRWYGAAIKGENTLLYIIEPKCGVVRLDKKDDSAEISIYLLPEFQNQGRGTAAIKSATKKAFKNWHIKEVVAYILEGNDASIKSFEKAGYFEQVSDKVGCVCMVRE